MTQAIQKVAEVMSFFTPEQEQIILNTFLGGASRQEAQVLLATVSRRRLDPFSRQVYFVKRWDEQKHAEVWAIQTSIDGLRSIAERTGKYDGQDEPEYGVEDGQRFCKVKVYRKDWARPAVGVAYFNEFVQHKKDGSVTKFWRQMPKHMHAKCAEALAIRKAFPEDTGGLYIAEEFGAVDDGVTLHPAEDREQAPPKRDVAQELAEKAKQQLPPRSQSVPPPSSAEKPTPEPARKLPGLATARAKAKWNAEHPDKVKALSASEMEALSAAGELPFPEKEEQPPQSQSGDDGYVEFDKQAEDVLRRAQEAKARREEERTS
jgi:phage recombination protein Bet